MFGKESKKISENKVSERNVIGKNTQIKGDIISEGDFRIDGNLDGTINTKGRVIVGQTGFIKGKVTCTNADIEGKFSGELIVANTLTVKGTANINGDVIIGKLSVEPGASFNATCAMKGSVKELNNNEQKHKEKTA
ncbi:bactofilin family protein [Tenacibaculum piscium]|uniref:Cell shape determination protein CcmA n=3 Tax=Tenacibaculum piscium TaxID=1458515 RepID=A0A2H1YKV4_9FLAO|nr:polymer-forming cytoskeletal protein [Tenacibaculum piscium]MBE7629242.1 polymer-forming cytoskeletal protein [Tenacibaculum piscium]MBE7670029.1 polymer-forming cytoskeletal protein [Tenacibaculum piscium]MBE7685546.1 polymer-forming cytoskeletal protein [Tenacibaculum piscium]MBE7690130.1 polymer-forming cytoskeletal protein [Tenacibaculum piscium]MCG8183311.1 polymer-forming cytoskeletal protein [Tenacibaculum piscium]